MTTPALSAPIDRADTDESIVLSTAESRQTLLDHWTTLTGRTAKRFWDDCTDDERDAILAAQADGVALTCARLDAARASGAEHLGSVA